VSLKCGSGEIDWGGRDDVPRGVIKMAMKDSMVPTRKRPNIQLDAILARSRALVISAGNATV
jgi:hypothetical protein